MTRFQPFSFWSMPPKEDWKVFLEHFDRLAFAEATLQFSHPHLTIYSKEERDNFPVPEVMACRKWLKEQID